jgi:hypothetical protein
MRSLANWIFEKDNNSLNQDEIEQINDTLKDSIFSRTNQNRYHSFVTDDAEGPNGEYGVIICDWMGSYADNKIYGSNKIVSKTNIIDDEEQARETYQSWYVFGKKNGKYYCHKRIAIIEPKDITNKSYDIKWGPAYAIVDKPGQEEFVSFDDFLDVLYFYFMELQRELAEAYSKVHKALDGNAYAGRDKSFDGDPVEFFKDPSTYAEEQEKNIYQSWEKHIVSKDIINRQ